MPRKPKTDAPVAKRKPGRPSSITPDVAEAVCSALVEGKSLRQIEADGIATMKAVLRRLDADEGFRAQYARARELQAEAMALEILEIADTPAEGIEETSGPLGLTVKRGDMLGHRKLQVDTRRWLLSKLLPKKYGDKLAIGGAEDLPPVKHDVEVSPGEAYKRMLEGKE
jgi:hypothetical protein